MWYLFNGQNQCIGTISGEPNHEDLETRGEFAIFSELVLPVAEVGLINSEVVHVPLPPPTLDELKAAKLAEIVAARTVAERAGISYLGKVFDTDADSLIRINIAAQSARNAMFAGEEWSIDWVNGAEATTFTAVEFLGLLDAITNRNNHIFEISRELKERAEAAGSEYELNAIVVAGSF